MFEIPLPDPVPRPPALQRAPIAPASSPTPPLLEEPEASLDVTDGFVSLTLRPFELVTLRLR